MCSRACDLPSPIIHRIQRYPRACPHISELIPTRASYRCRPIQVLNPYLLTHLKYHLSWYWQLAHTQLIEVPIVYLCEDERVVPCEDHHATILSSTDDSKDSGFVISERRQIQKIGEGAPDLYSLEAEAWGGGAEGFSREEESLGVLEDSEEELVIDVACGINLEVDTAIKSLEGDLEHFWRYFRNCITQGIISSH
jgi:hypothetical protein